MSSTNGTRDSTPETGNLERLVAIWIKPQLVSLRSGDRGGDEPVFAECDPAYGSTEPQMPPVMATVNAPMTSTQTG
jgi:hypothetical protein